MCNESGDRDLWSEVRKIRARGRLNPRMVDGASNPEDIGNLFAEKFNADKCQVSIVCKILYATLWFTIMGLGFKGM